MSRSVFSSETDIQFPAMIANGHMYNGDLKSYVSRTKSGNGQKVVSQTLLSSIGPLLKVLLILKARRHGGPFTLKQWRILDSSKKSWRAKNVVFSSALKSGVSVQLVLFDLILLPTPPQLPTGFVRISRFVPAQISGLVPRVLWLRQCS